MILAAGLGTRMKELTESVPKPLLEINNIPLIQYNVNLFSYYGIKNITINSHYKSLLLENYINSLKNNINFCLKHEETLLDTGGGVKNARECLNSEYFFLINSDIITDYPLSDLFKIYIKEQPIAIMVVKDPQPDYSSLQIKNGKLIGFGNKIDNTQTEPAMFTGIHLLSKRVFDYLPKGKSSIISDFYIKALEKGEKILTIKYDGLWLDLGTREKYLKIKDEIENRQILLPDYLSEGRIS